MAKTMKDREQGIATEIVAHVQAVADLIVEWRELAARARTQGPKDATAVAGYLAGALLRAGAGLADGNANRLRWHFEETPEPRNDPRGIAGARSLMTLLFDMLERRVGSPDLLRRVAEVWPKHATKGEAERAMAGDRAAPPAPTTVQRPIPHPTSAAAPTIPLVDKAPTPPGTWKDGEYTVEAFVRQPTVG